MFEAVGSFLQQLSFLQRGSVSQSFFLHQFSLLFLFGSATRDDHLREGCKLYRLFQRIILLFYEWNFVFPIVSLFLAPLAELPIASLYTYILPVSIDLRKDS